MLPIVQEIQTKHTPETLVRAVTGEAGVMMVRSGDWRSGLGGATVVVAWPFLRLRSWGTRCEVIHAGGRFEVYGDPWRVLASLMARYEALGSVDFPFPLGGCFGIWGYGLKRFLEPRLAWRAKPDLGLPDADLSFHDSLVVFDRGGRNVLLVSTGLGMDGSQSEDQAQRRLARWGRVLDASPGDGEEGWEKGAEPAGWLEERGWVGSNLSREDYVEGVLRAQSFIRCGDIYQVNLSQRLVARAPADAWAFSRRLGALSPAPFSAWLDAGEYRLASSSPELFLRLSGNHVITRPIKGTRPRGADPTRDAQWGFELQTSVKERAELLMITDLLRNDLGRVCEFGSVAVPELMRLERFAQVQHLVSTVEGELRPAVTHLEALAACFPGGSITGAPKFRAIEIIDELERVSRGPYTGALGYLGFNRESQLSMVIRTAVLQEREVSFHTGAGIVADSDPEAEYEETLTKARAFLMLTGGPGGGERVLTRDRQPRFELE